MCPDRVGIRGVRGQKFAAFPLVVPRHVVIIQIVASKRAHKLRTSGEYNIRNTLNHGLGKYFCSYTTLFIVHRDDKPFVLAISMRWQNNHPCVHQAISCTLYRQSLVRHPTRRTLREPSVLHRINYSTCTRFGQPLLK